MGEKTYKLENVLATVNFVNKKGEDVVYKIRGNNLALDGATQASTIERRVKEWADKQIKAKPDLVFVKAVLTHVDPSEAVEALATGTVPKDGGR